jgi:hypothetical protein
MIDRTPYVPIAAGVAASASNAVSSNGGADWPGAIETVAGALIGGGDDSDGDDGGVDDSAFGDDAGDTSTPLGDAQPFRYTPDSVSGDVEEIAKSTNNPNYAAKMRGYARDTFGNMVHVMKDNLDLRGDDNVIWHDNGNIEFRKNVIGNMHDCAF